MQVSRVNTVSSSMTDHNKVLIGLAAGALIAATVGAIVLTVLASQHSWKFGDVIGTVAGKVTVSVTAGIAVPLGFMAAVFNGLNWQRTKSRKQIEDEQKTTWYTQAGVGAKHEAITKAFEQTRNSLFQGKIEKLKPAKVKGPVASYASQAAELKQQIEKQLESANFSVSLLKSVWDNQVKSNKFSLGNIKEMAIRNGAWISEQSQLDELVDITQKMINYALLKVKADYNSQI